MTIIFKNQNVMARVPQLSTNTQHIRLACAIAGTDNNCCCCVWIRYKPGTDLVISTQGRKSHVFRRQFQFKRTKGIIFEDASFLSRTYKRFDNIDGSSEQHAYHTNATTETPKQDLFQRRPKRSYIFKHKTGQPF